MNICLFFQRLSKGKLNEAHFPPHFWVSLIVLPSHCKTVETISKFIIPEMTVFVNRLNTDLIFVHT